MKAIVIGGGPAGCSAAIGLLRNGFEVSLFEQRANWTGRVCGCFLNPEAVRHLKWLGVLNDLTNNKAVLVPETILYPPAGNSAKISTEQTGVCAMALPRKELENILLSRVMTEGGAVHFGSRVMEVAKDGTKWHVKGRNVGGLPQQEKADVVVQADGRFTINDKPHPHTAHGWYGFNACFERVPQNPGDQSFHIIPGGYVGVLTFRDGTSNVCGLVKRRVQQSKKWEEVFEEVEQGSPSLRNLLLASKRITDWHGVGPLPFSNRMRARKEFLLSVGDAAAVGDPFMGEGIGRALAAGPILDLALRESHFNETQNWPALVRCSDRIWKRTYQKRLYLGRGLRWLMGCRPLWPGLGRLLCRSKLINSLTPLFHVGLLPPTSI